MKYFKLQIHNGTTKENFVDEAIADNRITVGEKHGKGFIEEVKPDDIVMVHKGNTPYCLVQVLHKMSDEEVKVGASFGFDYKIKVLSYFKDVKNNRSLFIKGYKTGPNGTFTNLKNNTKTRKEIIKWFHFATNFNPMQDILDLLEYKKQIILQGPPGTGKTRLAKEIAISLTKEIKRFNAGDKIEEFLSNYQPSEENIKQRKELDSLLSKFREKFKVNELKNISLEEYALGSEEKDNFCYWLEYILIKNGRYTGHASKGKILWDPVNEEYKKYGFIKDIKNDEEAMVKVASLLDDIVTEKKVNYPIGKGFVLKVLTTYFPDKYFPINSENCLDNLFKVIGKETGKINYIKKNKLIQNYYLELKNKYKTDITSNEFMEFLFDEFGLKEDVVIEGNELLKQGEFKTIQFHPSYTYEDFVRGISVTSNNNNQIEYRTENRILAKFAKKALHNKNANYVLIIDEINRANLSSVLGELIYALEYRGEVVDSMYKTDEDGSEIIIPSNLYIIGTMNTADRSVGQIDYAIRRRFAFVDVLPKVLNKSDLKKEGLLFEVNEFRKVSKLFVKNDDLKDNKLIKSDYLNDDFNPKDVWLGHSYFIHEEGQFNLKLEYEIKPILMEYVKDGILNESALDYIDGLGKQESSN